MLSQYVVRWIKTADKMKRIMFCIALLVCLFESSVSAQKQIEPLFYSTHALESPYGLSSEITRRNGEFDIREEVIGKITASGAGWTRLPMWWDVFYHKGNFIYRTYDEALRSVETSPLSVLGVISPSYDKKLNAWSNPSEFALYVKELCFRYRNYISAWEVIPGMDAADFNGSRLTPQQFYTTLRGTNAVLKAANPDNKIVLGALNRTRSVFLDSLCKYDGHKYFDVMSFTSYGDAEAIIGQANGLRRTMDKHKFEKPVWLTMASYGSAQKPDVSRGFWEDVVPAALGRLGISPGKVEVAVVSGTRKGVAALNSHEIKDYLEDSFKKVHVLANYELTDLDPKKIPVLIPGRNVPESEVEAYLSKGGTVILDEPCWPSFTHIGVLNGPSEDAASKGLMAVPEKMRTADGFSFRYSWHFSTKAAARYLTDENLEDGDEMIPLLLAGKPGAEGVVSAIYRIAGKGNVIVQSRKGTIPYVNEEDVQARRIARVHLISFACGIDKVFWNGLRSIEKIPEKKSHHTGLYHADLSPKPAAKAYSTLTSMLPSGSSRPRVMTRSGLYLARWKTPAGEDVWAVWSSGKTFAPSEIQVYGKARYVDYMGEKQKSLDKIDTGVTYILNAQEVKIK